MKKAFTLFGILIASTLFAQSSFKTRIVTPGDGSLYSIVQLSDGTYAGAGYINEDIYLVKMTSSGELISARIVGTAGYDDGVSIIRTSDNGLAVGGVLNDQMAILKLDENLTVLWQKSYPAGNNSYGYHLIQTADGGYMITGYTEQGDKYAGYAVKTNSEGSVMMAKRYFDFGNSTVNDIVATSDGNYAMLADASTSGSGKDSSYLIKINPAGAVLWSKYLNTSTNSQYPASLMQSSDGGLVVAGSVYQTFPTSEDPYSFEQMMMAKFSAAGDLLWSKKMSPSATSESYAYKAMEDKDGGYVFSGALSVFNNKLTFQNNNSFLVKLSSSGSLVWTKTFDASDVNLTDLTDVIQTSNNGYAVCGYTDLTNDDTDYEDGIFYKFDAGFSLCGGEGSFGSVDTIGSGIAKAISSGDLTVTVSQPSVSESAGGSIISGCSVLPLQLLSFNAALQNKSIHIEWKTANEINTDYFVIERGSSLSSFTAMQQVAAKGNSSSVQAYAITDTKPMFGTSFYRLKQVDKNGAVTYSGVAAVTVSVNGTIAISPNPVHDNIRILLQSEITSALSLQVTDLAGKIILTRDVKVNAGTNTILLPAASLPQGMYIVRAAGNNTIHTVKFVKQ